MASTDDYLALLTSQHRQKPNFAAAVVAMTGGFVDGIAQQLELIEDFDLDSAVGVQLDAVGAWAGVTRRLAVPLTGIYFAWDGAVTVGWDSGTWQGQFDPTTGLVTLPDDAYRTLIRAKIAANHWDGTTQGALDIWQTIFSASGQTIILQDNQDMTMVVGFVGQPMNAVQQALLTGGKLSLKPAGVSIIYYALPFDTGPMFAWDVTPNSNLGGWDGSSWCYEVLPS